MTENKNSIRLALVLFVAQIFRGIVLGVLLSISLALLLTAAPDTWLFRYQGY